MYAEKHGYMYKVVKASQEEMLAAINPRMHCTWYKVTLILSILKDTEFLVKNRIRYIMWIDADAMVINHSRRLEELLEIGCHKDFIIAEDMNEGCLLNAGVFFLRVCPWSAQFWQEVWESDSAKRFYDCFYYEQSVITRLLKGNEGFGLVEPFHSYKGGPEVKLFPHVGVLSRSEMNTKYTDLQGGNAPRFIYHPAGSKGPVKLKLLEKVLKERSIHVPPEIFEPSASVR
eukprot:GFYU01039903.1.p1 GENE.GFYU01039903.1~~GFYU01039903.1.p1  ORF type:complete len:230 (+),score=31.70 GFYU01039903.1:3-692(+)